MNKFVNSWIVLFFLLSLPLVLALEYGGNYELFGLKLPGPEFKYNTVIYSCLAALILILGILKASRRWMGMRIAAQTKKFLFSAPISKPRKNRIITYGVLETTGLFAGAYFYANIVPVTMPVALVFLLLVVEHIAHMAVGLASNSFRVGITKNAVVCNDRDVSVMYFSGLRKVSIHQQTLYFEYIKELTLHVPVNSIDKSNWKKFKQILQQQVNVDKVYFNQAFKDYPEYVTKNNIRIKADKNFKDANVLDNL